MERKAYGIYSSESTSFGKTAEPSDARVQVLGLDKAFIEGCMAVEVGWYKSDCVEAEMVMHPDSDRVIMFLGSDVEHFNDLNAEIELWIENDKITMDQCCAVYIPAGKAYGKIRVKNLKTPVAFYAVEPQTDEFVALPAEPSAPAGAFANNMVERFEPSNGYMPGAPEGLLIPLVWIDGGRVEGAPYAEAVWFVNSSEEGPDPHVHDYDEFVSFMGTDADNPTDLGCTVEFYIGGEPVEITETCTLFLPAGTVHGPFFIRNLTRPILHTSGYAGSDYQKTEI